MEAKHKVNSLRNLRLMQGLTQAEVAERLGYVQQAYSKLENGLLAVTVDKVVALAEILQVTPSVIIDLLTQDKKERE